MVALSCNKIVCLVHALFAVGHGPEHVLAWSVFRRSHQALAMGCHRRRQTACESGQNGSATVVPATVTDEFHRLAFEAGLPPIRLHDLRHGAATIALAGGVDMKTVQAMLRHSSITITADTYTSVLPEVAKRAAGAAAAVVPRKRAIGDRPHTPGLPTGSQAPGNNEGRPLQMKNAQVGKGRPPGARTRNPRIKSPLLCH